MEGAGAAGGGLLQATFASNVPRWIGRGLHLLMT